MAANFACQFALIAFAVAEMRGAMLGGDFAAATKIALLAGMLSFVLGLVTGNLARHLAEESALHEFEQMIGLQNDQRNRE